MNDHYASLGVDREATRSEIDEAFARERDMAWSDERIRELKAAYQTPRRSRSAAPSTTARSSPVGACPRSSRSRSPSGTVRATRSIA